MRVRSMKFSIVISLVIIMCLIPFGTLYAYGSDLDCQEQIITMPCGDGIYGEYYPQYKRLDIKTDGNGIMNDYVSIDRPWETYAAEIKELNVFGDVRHIGAEAFRGMTSLQTADFYCSIDDIGEEAFKEWPSETVVDLYTLTKSDYEKGQLNENFQKLVAALKPYGIGVYLVYDDNEEEHTDEYAGTLYDQENYKLKESLFKGFSSSAIYTGKNITLNRTSKKLQKNRDYSISYKNNKNVGTATVIIKGSGNYHGSIKKTFKIRPIGVKKINSITANKDFLKVTWTKQTAKMSRKHITGYQIKVSAYKNFPKGKTKTKTIKGFDKSTAKIKGLKLEEKYYIKMRTFMTVDGKTYYSKWSDVKTKKIS